MTHSLSEGDNGKKSLSAWALIDFHESEVGYHGESYATTETPQDGDGIVTYQHFIVYLHRSGEISLGATAVHTRSNHNNV